MLPPLHVGDVLLYSGYGLMGAWVRWKTWSDVSHAEVYTGNGLTFTALWPGGVQLYPFSEQHLRYVLRPKFLYDADAAAAWRQTVLGQAYDLLGLAVFYLAAKQGAPDRMFCSEAVTRDARAAGIEPFAPNYDADRVAPATFLTSTAYRLIWAAEK